VVQGTLMRTTIHLVSRADYWPCALAVRDDRRAGEVGLWIELVRVPPSGTWERRRADLYAVAADWVGPPDVDVAQAKEHAVRRYLGGFGAATAAPGADFHA
jgi:hypothetical protein